MHLIGLLLGPDTSWLLRTDVLLGFLTLLCVAVVVVATARGVICRLCSKKNELIKGDHTTTLSQLGISPSDTEDQPDEKELHPGHIPGKHIKNEIHPG
jgi:hypothetical protein